MASARMRATLAAGLWLAWAAIALGAYYRQLWRLLGAGPAAWRPSPIAVADGLLLLTLGGALLLGLLVWIPVVRRLSRSARASWLAVGILVLGPLYAIDRLPGWAALASVAAAAGLPAFAEAVPRALRGIIGCAAVLAAAQVPGAALLRLVGAGNLDARTALLFRTAAGLGALAYLLLALAALHIYTAVVVRLLIPALLLIGVVGFRRGMRNGDAGEDAGRAETPRPAGSAGRLWPVLALLAMAIAFVGALAPESGYDALWYHLEFPRLWLSRGTLVDLPAEYVSLYPMTWELLYGAGLALGGPVGAKLLHFAALPLLALLVYELARRYLPGTPPWLAVALFVSVPTVLWEATTAYTDLALTLHSGLALYALLRYGESAGRPWLLLAALQTGLALATKHLGFLVLAVAAAGLAVFLLRRRGPRGALGPVAILLAVSLLVPAPWYARSALRTGNPVFPEFFELFGAPPDRWDAVLDARLTAFEAHFGRPRTISTLLSLPWDTTVHAARYGGALGPLFLLLIPGVLPGPAIPAARVLGLGAIGYAALWASSVSSLQMRFLMPITPLLALLAAGAFSRWRRVAQTAGADWGAGALTGVIAILILLNLPPFTPLHEVDRTGWEGWLTHVVRGIPTGVVVGRHSAERYLASAVPSYRAWRYVNTHLPPRSRILTFSGGDNFYSARDRLGVNTVAARPAVWAAPAGAERGAVRALARLQITHILFDKAELTALPPGSLAIGGLEFRRAWLAPQYEDERFALFRIRWEDAPAMP